MRLGTHAAQLLCVGLGCEVASCPPINDDEGEKMLACAGFNKGTVKGRTQRPLRTSLLQGRCAGKERGSWLFLGRPVSSVQSVDGPAGRSGRSPTRSHG